MYVSSLEAFTSHILSIIIDYLFEYFSGPNAPLASNLISWLKNHPTYEIVRPGQLPTSKFYSQPKSAAARPTAQTNPKTQQKSPVTGNLKQSVLTPKPGTKQIILSTKIPPVKPSRIVLIQPRAQVLKCIYKFFFCNICSLYKINLIL